MKYLEGCAVEPGQISGVVYAILCTLNITRTGKIDDDVELIYSVCSYQVAQHR